MQRISKSLVCRHLLMQCLAWGHFSGARAQVGDYAPLPIEVLKGEPEPIGPSSRTTGLIISEVMYHPETRVDERNLEYVEILNTEEWSIDLSGYRLSGDVDFDFPDGTVVPTRSYLVVAASPGDMNAVYGLSGVLGPWEGSLPNNSGTVRLRHPTDAIFQEVEYDDQSPWPVGADGTGHSIVLAKPSYGERDPRAWSRSELRGGSPGEGGPALESVYRPIFINEFLAHTDDPVLDYVELFNYSGQSIDISGCILSDDPQLNKFVIPDGTSIPAKGHLVFGQNELGFALSSEGETVLLKTPGGEHIIDAVRFGGQENGVATGRYPDGAPQFHRLTGLTPGSANAPLRIDDIVINEIMYNSINRDDADEYVELFNKGTGPVDVSGWRINDDIQFTFPENTVIAAAGYLVIAKDTARLIANYPSLDAANTLGNFSGSLSNSGGRIALEMPDEVTEITPTGTETKTIWITMDEVTFKEGGRWGEWADAGGSSLELVDPESDNRRASNWADSDETNKASWTTISHAGVLDNGEGAIDELQVMLLSAGEALVDDMNVSLQGQGNRLPNPSLDSSFQNWVAHGNHVFSGLSGAGQGFNGTRALHLVATGGGDNGANRVESDLTSPFSAGQTATISARVRWLKGSPNILLRLHGNHLELSGVMEVPGNLGTPGSANSREVPNRGPSISEVTHFPVVPSSLDSVRVSARVNDPDGVSSVVLKYRVDPATTFTSLTMEYNGAGIYSSEIPGQSGGSTVAFYVEAQDSYPRAAVTTFPADPANAECLVRFGERDGGPGFFDDYRIWVTNANLSEWTNRERLSNQLIDSTFVYGNVRAVYNAGARYRGSAFIRTGYPANPASSSPTSLVVEFPKDDLFLGADKINLDGLEQPGRDDTLQREKMTFWIGEQLGISISYQRYVHLFFNGTEKGQIFTDSHQPDNEYISDWYPDEDEGELFKVDDWFEFNDNGNIGMQFNRDARLLRYLTTGGEYKQARYRWSWEKKTNGGLNDDFTRLFDLVDALHTSGDDAYTSAVESLVDVDQWMRAFAVRHIASDWDGYGYRRGKNASIYKPVNGKWKMLPWDFDISLGTSGLASDSTSHNLFDADDPTMDRFYAHPTFRRVYLRILKEAVNGPLLSSNHSPVMDAIYAAFQRNSVSAAAPNEVKSWIAARRSYILGVLSSEGANTPLAITTNGGLNFSTSQNLVLLRGTAPVEAATLVINNAPYPVKWTAVDEWEMTVPLVAGPNSLLLEALDIDGQKLAGMSDQITVTFNGVPQAPEDYLVINEIMYHPLAPDTEFIELFNTSTTQGFDLSGYILNGTGFTFPGGVIIGPQQYGVVVENQLAFVNEYGGSAVVFGEFSGSLDNGGETISLIKPGANPGEEVLVDQVSYEDGQPWPALADGLGPSLQLIDPARDNRRVSNWDAIEADPGIGETITLISMTDVWKYNQSGSNLGTSWRASTYNDASWPSGAALLYVEGSQLPAPKNTPLNLGQITYYFRKYFNVESPAGLTLNARTVLDDGAVFYLNGTEWFRVGMSAGTVTYQTFANRVVTDAELETVPDLPAGLLVAGDNVIAVEVHQTSSGSSDIVFGLELEGVRSGTEASTPGKVNSNRAVLGPLPLVFLNEVQPENISGPTDGAGEREPWVEIYNAGSQAVDLSDFYLSNDYGNLLSWRFPQSSMIGAGEFLLVWLDGEAGESTSEELHASFAIPAATGSVVLTKAVGAEEQVIDFLNYQSLSPGRSYGAHPDGKPNQRQDFIVATPSAMNSDEAPPVSVIINEWMASNSATVTDPSDGNFDDWIELFNAGDAFVDLSGYYLTDDLLDWDQFEIPAGTVIPAAGFLLVWADNDDEINGTGAGVHANFQLSAAGEVIALYAPDGSLVDQVTFGEQTPDISEGLWPDGDTAPAIFMSMPTPGSANIKDSLPGGDEGEITMIEIDPENGVSISVVAVAGNRYALQYKDDLNDPEWISLPEVVAQDSVVILTDPEVAEENRFYQVVLMDAQ